jgi:predicted DNA-binding transcriptional regulator YafY
MALHLPENERMWFSLILGFGNKVKVLAPEELKIRITDMAEEILTNYNTL